MAQLILWAGPSTPTGEGTSLTFRLSLSGMFGPAQENRFDRWGPWPAGRTWRLDERMSREDGNVRVVAEFLTAAGSSELLRGSQTTTLRQRTPAWAAGFSEPPPEVIDPPQN